MAFPRYEEMGKGHRKPNELLKDGRTMKFEGRTYRLIKAEYVWTDNPDSEYYGEKWPYYKVINTKKKRIGKITTFTSEQRLASLIYRFHHPEHMKPLEFAGTVRKKGVSLYVRIPKKLVEDCDVWPDDSVELIISNMQGQTITKNYHTAEMNEGCLNVNLTKLKRYAYVDGQLVKIDRETYSEEMRTRRYGETPKINFVIEEGKGIFVKLNPKPAYQKFDFTKESIEQIKKEVGRELLEEIKENEETEEETDRPEEVEE